MSEGQKPDSLRAGVAVVLADAVVDTVLDLARLGRAGVFLGGVAGAEETMKKSSGSSTSGFLLRVKKVPERESGLGEDWGETSCDCLPDEDAAAVDVSASVSFFRVNQSPEGFPVTLMVSFASLSIDPMR